jgi:hypothetical protein
MFSSGKIFLTAPKTISIAQQPTDQTAVGGAATFSTVANVSPSGTPSYQWQSGILDPTSWSEGRLPESHFWSSVVYGNGLFVALMRGGMSAPVSSFALSSDGATWILFQNRLQPAHWMGGAYGGGVFVAVSGGSMNSNFAARSTDGSTWSMRGLPASRSWAGVAYGNGLFLAVAIGSDVAATSSDGDTWAPQTMPYFARWGSIAYGGGLFVAVAQETGLVAVSSDGVSWSTTAIPGSPNLHGVTYGSGVFVAVTHNSNKAFFSGDGMSWTQSTLPITSGWRSVTYGDGMFVAASEDGDMAFSNNGVFWSQAVIPSQALPYGRPYGIAYGKKMFVAVGTGWNSYTSGISWSDVSGANSSALELAGLTSADDGNKYRAIAGAFGAKSVASNAATLTVP